MLKFLISTGSEETQLEAMASKSPISSETDFGQLGEREVMKHKGAMRILQSDMNLKTKKRERDMLECPEFYDEKFSTDHGYLH